MKVSDLILIGGVAFIGYWLWKKNQPKPEPIELPIKEDKKEEKKTIILNLNNHGRKINQTSYSNPYVRDFDTRKQSTVAPASTTITRNYDF